MIAMCEKCGVEKLNPHGESPVCVDCYESTTHYVGRYNGCDVMPNIYPPSKEEHNKYLYWYGVKSMECDLCHMIFKEDMIRRRMIVHERFHMDCRKEKRNTTEGKVNWIRGY